MGCKYVVYTPLFYFHVRRTNGSIGIPSKIEVELTRERFQAAGRFCDETSGAVSTPHGMNLGHFKPGGKLF